MPDGVTAAGVGNEVREGVGALVGRIVVDGIVLTDREEVGIGVTGMFVGTGP